MIICRAICADFFADKGDLFLIIMLFNNEDTVFHDLFGDLPFPFAFILYIDRPPQLLGGRQSQLPQFGFRPFLPDRLLPVYRS